MFPLSVLLFILHYIDAFEHIKVVKNIKKLPFGLSQQKAIFLNNWCPDSESNQGHGDFQSPALPTELSGQTIKYKLFKWWAFRDLNPGPAGYEPDALTN